MINYNPRVPMGGMRAPQQRMRPQGGGAPPSRRVSPSTQALDAVQRAYNSAPPLPPAEPQQLAPMLDPEGQQRAMMLSMLKGQ